jgi:hypothetical protein
MRKKCESVKKRIGWKSDEGRGGSREDNIGE